ncbi:Phage Terminase [compost metagenome]
MGGTIKTVERKLAEGTFVHGGRPMMAWSVSNARIEQRANSILITKQASGTAKIDPLMALLDASHLMALNPSASGKSVYESRGMRFL